MLEIFSWLSEAPDRFHLFIARRLAPIAMRDTVKLSQNTKSETEQTPVQRACSDAGSGRRPRGRTVSRENSGSRQAQIPSIRADFAESGHPFNVRIVCGEQRQILLLG